MNWDKPEERQEWFHNMSSVLQAGPTVLTNQLDYDREVMHKVNKLTRPPHRFLRLTQSASLLNSSMSMCASQRRHVVLSLSLSL